MKIQDLFQQAGIGFLESGHHHCRPGWLQVKTCPWCHSDNYHLGFNLQAHFFVCWRCRGHRTLDTLAKLGIEESKIRDFWAGREVQEVAVKKRTGLVEPEGRGRLLRIHRDYLRSRGFDPKTLQRLWNLEGIGLAARLSWRIYIPIILAGQRVSWTTRAVGEKVARRYISAGAEEEALNHKGLLYGSDYCRHAAVVVEGPVDAWRIGPGAVALCGTAFTGSQVRKLIQFPYRFICFDNSPEAQALAQALARQLAPFPGTTEVLEIDAADPGSASEKEVRLIRRTAKLI